MENDDRHCVLIWGQGRYRRSVPHSSSTNTPTFRTAPATTTYRTFVALYEAMEAQYHRREHVLQLPGLRPNVDEEFVAEENLLLDDVDKSVFADATHDDVTSPTSNLEKEAETEEEEINVTRMGPLTFDLTPLLESLDRVDVVAGRPSRTDAMASPSRPSRLCQTQGSGGEQQDPQETCQGQAADMCRLPLRGHDQGSLARKGQRG